MSRRPAAEVVSDLAVALLGVPPPLGLRCWDGSTAPGPEGSPTLIVRHPRALRRIVYAADELGLARAYVSGDLDLEGDLYAVLEFPRRHGRTAATELDRGALRPLLGRPAAQRVLGPPPGHRPRRPGSAGCGTRCAGTRPAISHHYDVGNDFYELVLGPSHGLLAAPTGDDPTPTDAWRTPSATSSTWSAASSACAPRHAAARRRLRLGLDGHARRRELRRPRRRRHPLPRAGRATPASGSRRRA